MRNLKRALSLALASVMVMGMMVVGTSASYKDVSSEQNQEAIEVLQTVGIMVGDENGNFNPDALVTRNEMAVVMSNLLDYRVASYKGTAPFADVPAWAEPYVAACYTNGIIAGYSSTYFGGSDNVTTAQAALMLLKALGYFQYQSDFADDWQLATVAQGNKIELFDDVESNVREAMTRNDLAQLVLNALESGMVEADDNTINVTAPGVEVQAGKVKYNYVTSGKSYATAISDLSTAIGANNTSGPIVELGEKLYNGDLKKQENVTDDFGRPATKWSYKVDEIGTYGDDPIATYTAKASTGTLYSLLGSSNVDDLAAAGNKGSATAGYTNNLSVYVDGNGAFANGNSTVSSYFDRNSSSAAGGVSGKGVLTEVYQDDDNNVTLVFINTYLMQATDDYNASKGSVSVTVLTEPTTGTVSENALNDDEFENITDIAEDDYILYTVSRKSGSWDVKSVAKATVVTGEVTAYDNKSKTYGDAGGSVTIEGTKYDYAKYADVSNSNGCNTTFVVTDTAVIVTDAYGYALYVDDASISVGNYVYIDAIATQTNLSTKVIADAYFTDGTNETIVVKEMKNGAADLTTRQTGSLPPLEDNTVKGWFSYSKNSKDEYTLKKAATTAALTGTSIDQNKVSIAGTVSGNKDTLFIVKDKNDDIKLYTGISNVPDITNLTPANSWYMRDKDTAGKVASVVFVDASNGSVKNNNESLLYLLDKDSTTVDNTDNEPVYTWVVLLNGEKTSIRTKQVWTAGDLYENYSIDSDNYYEVDSSDLFDTRDADKFIVNMTDKAISNSGDTLTIAGNMYVTDENTNIHLVMAPTTKGAADTLSGTIMTNNNADYELMLGITSRGLANKFKNYTVTGRYYVIYDDKNGSDLITDLYVVVTAANYHGLETPTLANEAVAVSGTPTALNAGVTPATGHSVAYQWQSFDGTTWVSASGTSTNATYTPDATTVGVTQYRCQITETVTATGATVGVSYTNAVTITVKPAAPTYTTGTAVGNASAETVTITSTSDYTAGTYNLYKDNVKVATLTLAADGALTFTGVSGTIESGDYNISVVENGVESDLSAAITVTVS